MKAFKPLVPVIVVLGVIASGCDKESDDLIPEPTASSTILSGYIKTTDGAPLVGIPVAFDYVVNGYLSSHVTHKAKGKTDKTGYYRIFFEADEDPGSGVSRNYTFSADFSKLSPAKYMISEKMDFTFWVERLNKLQGCSYDIDFRVPFKKLVEVTVSNDGAAVREGRYAVKNTFPVYDAEEFVADAGMSWGYSGGAWDFTDVEIPQNGSTSVSLPCAVGVENEISLVCLGYENIGFPTGSPVSDNVTVFVTSGFDGAIELTYRAPAE